MKLKVFNYYYYNNVDKENDEFNAPVLCIKCRDKERNNHLIQILDKENLTPRFGILQKDIDKILFFNPHLKYEVAPASLYGEKVYNVFTTFPWQVGAIKRSLNDETKRTPTQTFGADIKWEKKAMSIIIKNCNLTSTYIEVPDDYIYKFLKLEDIKPVPEDEHFLVDGRNCYWDIETDSRDLASGKMKYQDFKDMPIISITTYDNYEGEYYQFVWHPKFENDTIKEYNNYEIEDNVIDDKELTINKIIKCEYTNEKDMLIGFFEYFSKQRFDYMFGYFSVGGWSKQGKSKMWVDGFDSLCLYARTKELGLIENIQMMSSCPQMYGYKGRYDAVYMRSSFGKHELVIKGISQIDFVFSEKILAFAQRYYKFRGHKLADWARFFLGYNKLDKDDHHVYHYWDQSDLREIDYSIVKLENGLMRVKNKGVEFMLDYNLIDVKICLDLDLYFKVTKKQVGRTEVSISPADDGLTASKLHDHFKLTNYQEQYSFDTKYQKFKRPGINGKNQIGDKFTLTLAQLEEKARARGVKTKRVKIPLLSADGIKREGTFDITYRSLKDVGKAGGFVPVPLGRGIYENIGVIDFSKFYPNMIKSTNAGIVSAIDLDREYWFCVKDKKGNVFDRKDIIETPVSYFRKDIKSLNSILFDTWMVKRLEAQAKLQEYMDEYHTTKTDKYKMLWTEQFNIKNFMNAGFGVLGLEIDRTYSKLCFNSCTLSCQDVLMFSLFLIKSLGVEIIGGDTDSLFIRLTKKGLNKQIKEAKRICKWVNNCVNIYLNNVYNIQEHTIDIDLETISDKFFVDTMKHYIKRNLYAEGVILDKPELEIKGMDLKKRATSVIGAELQEALIDIIFETERNEEIDIEDSIRNYISKFDRRLDSRSWSDVCKRGPLNKSLDKYPVSNQSAMAARNTLKYLGRYYGPGSNPYLAVFSQYPSNINGKFLNVNGKDFVLSFDKQDEAELKKFKDEDGKELFKLNWARIRESECFKKTDHLLSIFNTNYYEIVEASDIGDSLAI